MKLTKIAEEIKKTLTLELAARGVTPMEFEEKLASLDSGEGVLKVAIDLNLLQDYVGKPALGAIGQLPSFALNASAAAGAAGGITFDELENGVVDLNKTLDREREKVQLVRRLTENLRKEHGLH
jgi:hypothetical protein